jgi:hypothetical protein
MKKDDPLMGFWTRFRHTLPLMVVLLLLWNLGECIFYGHVEWRFIAAAILGSLLKGSLMSAGIVAMDMIAYRDRWWVTGRQRQKDESTKVDESEHNE